MRLVCNPRVIQGILLGLGGLKLGVPYLGVLIRILLLGYYIRVPYFRKLPYSLIKGILV